MAKRNAKKTPKCPGLCIKQKSSDSGLPLTVPIGMPVYWSSEEALAVFQLIDDIREQLWAIYSDEIQELLQRQRNPPPDEPIHIDEDDLPF